MHLVAFLLLSAPLLAALITAEILQVTPENPDAGNRSSPAEKHSSTPVSSTVASSSSTRMHHENPTQKFDVKNYFRTNATRLGSSNSTDLFGYKRYAPNAVGEQQQPPSNATRQQLFKATFVTPQSPLPSTFSLGFGTGSYSHPTKKPTNIRTTNVMLPPESLFLFGSGNQRTTSTTISPTDPSTMPNMMEGCMGSGAGMLTATLQPLVLLVTFKMCNVML
ncbi:Hypothetical predicted protein [Drosophila guanche]|uniref:Uncharacterized protein n=1 Tax=Drosophila guanche TaxID=7266 RepID=A0A3B0K237_DROGU|nr:Hypothetical predicted protein [Drosophila guanche]